MGVKSLSMSCAVTSASVERSVSPSRVSPRAMLTPCVSTSLSSWKSVPR